jgi:hypothetical protein
MKDCLNCNWSVQWTSSSALAHMEIRVHKWHSDNRQNNGADCYLRIILKLQPLLMQESTLTWGSPSWKLATQVGWIMCRWSQCSFIARATRSRNHQCWHRGWAWMGNAPQHLLPCRLDCKGGAVISPQWRSPSQAGQSASGSYTCKSKKCNLCPIQKTLLCTRRWSRPSTLQRDFWHYAETSWRV